MLETLQAPVLTADEIYATTCRTSSQDSAQSAARNEYTASAIAIGAVIRRTKQRQLL